MSRNTSKINFYARESKKDKDGLVHIEMSININQKRVFINLPMQVEPQRFNSKRRPKEYEDYIAQMRTRINQILNDMFTHGEPITAERIREYVRKVATSPTRLRICLTTIFPLFPSGICRQMCTVSMSWSRNCT